MHVEPQLRTDPHLADVEAVPGQDQWETSGFHCRKLGPDTYALTYTLRQAVRLTRRLTLWRLSQSGWKVLCYQGTIIEPDQAGSPESDSRRWVWRSLTSSPLLLAWT
jgi:hypothetical protein